MPRPNARTPISNLIAVLNGLVPWCDAHHDALAAALPDADLNSSVCIALAARVQDAEAVVLGEQFDDKYVSTQATALFVEVRRFLKSTDASVQLALRHDARLSRVRDDLFQFAPSDVRSTRRARTALLRVLKALKTHSELLNTPHTNPDRRAEQAQAFLDQIAQHEVHKSGESAETARAYEARDQARNDAIQHIATLHLAARALEFDQPELFRELTALYDAHNPAPQRRKSDDDAPDLDPEDD